VINFVEVGRALNGDRLQNTLITQNALDEGRPFALLDRAGRLIECSAGFEAILRSRQVLGLRDRTLVAIHAQHRGAVERFLESALGVRRYLDRPMPIRLATPDCPRGIILRAVPLAEQNDVFDVFRPAALITLTDLDQPCRVLRQELVALFGLTEREADVTALVCEGVTTEKAAHQLAISEYTVRQHLKAVFGKIGVSRQAELVAIVSRLS
jgi:DNA-binding CsgD family transcriptional regulator